VKALQKSGAELRAAVIILLKETGVNERATINRSRNGIKQKEEKAEKPSLAKGGVLSCPPSR
jgi:hypothetical protein